MGGNTTGFRPWVIALCLALASHGVASQAEEPYFDIRFVRSSLAAARVTAAQLDYGLCTSGKPPIPLSEISIPESHEALLAGKLNCSQLVTGLLRRIDAYDKPLDLNAIMRLHPDALPDAAAKDEELKRIRQGEIGDALPPLFCIPILLKDNIDAAGLPTTAGSPALANNRPEGDSHVVAKLKVRVV
jgi:amidase